MPAAARVLADLMGLLDVESVNHAPPQFQTRALSDLNAALEEIYGLAPTEWWMTDDRGERVRAPTVVTLTVTQNSKAITFAGYASWMLGCTIIIDGDDNQNNLLSLGASPSLRFDYLGSSGVKGAMVYHDKVTLPTDTAQVAQPVFVDNWPLIPMPSKRDLQRGYNWNGPSGDYGSSSYGNTGDNLANWIRADKMISQPKLFLVERSTAFNAQTYPAISFDTLPDKQYTLSYQAQLLAPVVASFSDTRECLVPYGYEGTILLPMVRWRFSSWPQAAFSKDDTKTEYEGARTMLSTINPSGYQSMATEMQN